MNPEEAKEALTKLAGRKSQVFVEQNGVKVFVEGFLRYLGNDNWEVEYLTDSLFRIEFPTNAVHKIIDREIHLYLDYLAG